MHPALTFDVLAQDHRERLEQSRTLTRALNRQAAVRPDDDHRGRPPEHARHARARSRRTPATAPATTPVTTASATVAASR